MVKRSAPTSGGARPAEGASYKTRPLDASTWDAFAELVERNNGVYGGCWCIAHHSEYQRGVSDPRTLAANPNHETSVIASATQPTTESSAPR